MVSREKENGSESNFSRKQVMQTILYKNSCLQFTLLRCKSDLYVTKQIIQFLSAYALKKE